MQCWVPANNRRAFQRLLRLLPLCWYARNASCQQMLLTHDDALGIRMDPASILTSGPKGIIVGLIPCPWDGILLFIETMQNYCLLAHLLNIASAPRTCCHLVQGFKKLALAFNCGSLHNWRQTGPCLYTPVAPRGSTKLYFGWHKSTAWQSDPWSIHTISCQCIYFSLGYILIDTYFLDSC